MEGGWVEAGVDLEREIFEAMWLWIRGFEGVGKVVTSISVSRRQPLVGLDLGSKRAKLIQFGQYEARSGR